MPMLAAVPCVTQPSATESYRQNCTDPHGCATVLHHWLLFCACIQIDQQKPDVVLYPFGSRNPPGFAAWSEANAGVTQSENWQEFLTTHVSDVGKLTALFNEMDTDGSGEYFGFALGTYQSVVSILLAILFDCRSYGLTQHNHDCCSRFTRRC